MLLTMSAHPTPIQPPAVPVFVAARHRSVRKALWTLLETEPCVEPVAGVADLGDLRRLLARVAPPVVVVDEAVLGSDGIHGLPELIAAAPGTAFVVVGLGDHEVYVTRAREAGAADYVRLDDAERLGRAVVAAMEASAPFTAGRRRTGSRAATAVPAPGAASTVRMPPSSSTRSRIPIRPKPSDVAPGSKPRPAS
jgi:DNA-binding NarL/FixJ family response regulator